MAKDRPDTIRVLAVDDEQQVRELYEEFLSSPTSNYKFDLTLCHNSEEAVEAVRTATEAGKPFALAFIDIRLHSEQDGVWAAEQIRTLDPNIEIVMVTAYDDLSPEEIVSRVPPAGKLLYIKKPLSPEEIRQFTVALSAKWRQEVELRKILTELEFHVEERTTDLTKINEQLKREIEERRRAEEELRESEEKYRTILESIEEGYFEVDLAGNFTFFNDSLCEITGYPRDELMGMNNREYTSPETAKGMYHIFSKIYDTRKPAIVIDYEIIRKDGSIRVLEMSASLIQDSGGQPIGFRGVARDITERKRAEEALREGEERFREMAETIREAFWLFDWIEQRVIYVSPAYEEIWGRSIEDLYNRYSEWADSVYPDDRSYAKESFARIAQTGGGEPREYRIARPDGTVRWVSDRGFAIKDKDGQVRRIAGIAEDITERKQAEEALRQSEEKYRTALEANPDPVVVYDIEGKVVYFNPAFTRVFGWSLRERLGKKMDDFVPEKNWPETKKMINRTLAGESFSGIETRRYTKQGNIIPVSISGAVLREMDGDPVGSVINLRDISEQKNLERQLQQAQKMEAVGTLAGGIAHDFNNLLQAIQGYTELLLMRMNEGEQGWRELREVIRASKRGGELTQQLLTFSRKVESKRRPLDLNQEVSELRELMERTIPKMIDVKFELAKDLKVINADPAQLKQVLMNLAVNAQDAMAEGGQLHIETLNLTLDQEFCRKYAEVRPGDYVLLSISDTGHGMDKETLEHIFDPFYTTKEVGKGTGLGLAIVYGIIKNHEGYIMCYSRPGEGTTFKIYLPAIELEKDFIDVEASQEPHVLAKGGDETILLVDDEGFIRELGIDVLGQAGYKVLTAADGETALQLYRQQQGQIDLVILDLIMPGMGGSKCLEELLRMDPQAQILIASGYSPDASTKGTLETGAKGFVSKPYDTSQLLKLVREILDQN
jgi:PAS domain S-box-containing protein